MGFSIQTHNIYWEAVEHLMVNAWALETNWIKKDSKLFPLIALINERINF